MTTDHVKLVVDSQRVLTHQGVTYRDENEPSQAVMREGAMLRNDILQKRKKI